VDYHQLGPYLVAAFVVFMVYRRLRRSFGRQLLSKKRMGIRIAVLALIGCAVAATVAFKSMAFFGAMILGIAAGVALGLWGANRTRFEKVGGVLNYVPHTYTGIAVSLLFLGRLAYRLVALYGHGQEPVHARPVVRVCGILRLLSELGALEIQAPQARRHGRRGGRAILIP
jgi:hypothetical protein